MQINPHRVAPTPYVPQYTSKPRMPQNQAKKAKSTITETTPFINFLLALFGLGKKG